MTLCEPMKYLWCDVTDIDEHARSILLFGVEKICCTSLLLEGQAFLPGFELK